MKKTLAVMVLAFGFLGSNVLLLADDVSFPKTKYVIQDGGKDKEIKANLVFTEDSIIVKERKKPKVFRTIPYKQVTEIIYERSTHARAKTAILISPLALFSKGKKHWLTITYQDGDKKDFVLLKLDKKEYKRILATSDVRTGKKAERILEE